MYHLFKWLKERLGRSAAPASREPVAVSAPGNGLVSLQKAAVPGAGHGAAALSVRNLSEHFGDRVAFAGVCFDVGYGEVFGFLGPNGAGNPVTGLWRFFRQWRAHGQQPGALDSESVDHQSPEPRWVAA
jgi:hypothetical protein